MFAVYKKELRSYFITPIGYIFTAMFMAISGIAFCICTLFNPESSNIHDYFFLLIAIFAVLLPLLTMKSFSEEKKTKTEQLLLTAPVSLFSVVFGKYLAALTVFAASLAVNSMNFILLFIYGQPDGTIIMANIFALFCIGAAFIAVGIFLSSFTENQFVAAVTSITATVSLLAVYYLAPKISADWLRVAIKWFSVYDRFSAFKNGLFDINAVIYFISFSVVFIFLTVRVYEKRRWS